MTKEDIRLYGVALKVEPAQQTVPKDIATIVSVYLQTPTLPENLPPFAPGAEVKAVLRGPSFAHPVELSVKPNTPFNIPPLTVPGLHTLEYIRLVQSSGTDASGGPTEEVLLRGAPESVTIDVIEKLLVTRVTARPLSAEEIREKGIVFDKSNFQAYNFTAAFAIEDKKINIDFPVVLPNLQGAQDVSLDQASLPTIPTPPLPNLQTIIPDTLRLQTRIPNLTVVGFTLEVPRVKDQQLIVPPIPGVVVIPGDIGFLNQFFSVMLLVGNVAPPGSNLVVSDLRAQIVLPPGKDAVVGTPDDPLRMARTSAGEVARVQPVKQPGPDGKVGTQDDVSAIGPGESGNAEFLVEGRREGNHIVEMEISATLNGLPVGPVPVRGRAAGSVLVRNPAFTLTFTHPEIVNAGEAYTLDVTVTNTSQAPANFVSVNLYPRNVSGAAILGEPSRQVESIRPGDSAMVSFDMLSKVTGKVFAATLDSDENISGRFALKTSVGELGVPLSPDSLVLPKEAAALPKSVREAAIGLLGKAYAVATAPAAALPKDLRRFSKKIVWDRAVEVAEAGFRVSLREPARDSTAHLAMDFMGSHYSRLADLVKPGTVDFEKENYEGFDDLRRKSFRGDTFARAVAAELAPSLASQGVAAFHRDLAEKWSYRPGHVAVLAGTSGGPLPYEVSLLDGQGRLLGSAEDTGKVIKEIPFSDYMVFAASETVTGQMAVLASPAPGDFKVRLTRVPGVPADAPFTLSVVLPEANGNLRQVVYEGLTGGSTPKAPDESGNYNITFERFANGAVSPAPSISPSLHRVIQDPPPSVVGVVQQSGADVLRCDPKDPGIPVGRVVAMLFSEEVTGQSVQDKLRPEAISHYAPEGNRVVGVALQPGRRIAFLALRDPYGPFVPRSITVTDVSDLRGNSMASQTVPMEATMDEQAGVVSGRVLNADGTPIPGADVRLFYRMQCDPNPPFWVGISAKTADEQGRYSWDYVSRRLLDRIVAVDPGVDEFRDVQFNVQRNGQRLNVDIVFLGRGTFQGRTLAESGSTLKDTSLRVTSLTDNSQYGVRSGTDGSFVIGRVPVGNIFVEAVNTTAKAQVSLSEHIPVAGAIVERDITLLNVEQSSVSLRRGDLLGYVLRPDGAEPAADVPVYVYYQSRSQAGIRCPGQPEPSECPVALDQTDSLGAYAFSQVVAGELRLYTFDPARLQEGEAHVVLPGGSTRTANVLLSGGLGRVRGFVLDPGGNGVAGARVGGGLSLTTTSANGEFLLIDVPVGRRQIVAVSDAFGSSGRATIDIARAGEEVNAVIVLDAVGRVSGGVTRADGSAAANVKVYLFNHRLGNIQVVGEALTNESGFYSMERIPLGDYTASAFLPDFSDGNIREKVLVKYHNQLVSAPIQFRGAGGSVSGMVYTSSGTEGGRTPLAAKVGISGDRVLIAGGRVGVGFQHVRNFKIVDSNFSTGQYSFSALWTGPFTLQAAGAFSPDPITAEGEIPAPGARVVKDLRLQPTSQIRGTVFQPDGLVALSSNVVVRYKSDEFKIVCKENVIGEEECEAVPQGIQEETVVTDGDGRFWLPLVNPGMFTLTVEDPVTGKIGQARGSVRPGETGEMAVRLLGLGDITVQVRGSDAVTPIPGAKVTVEQLSFPKKKLTLVADSSGTASFSGGDAFTEGEFVVEALDVRNGFAGRASGKVTKDGEQVTVSVYLYDAWGTVFGAVYRPDGLTPVPNADVVISNNAGPLAFNVTDSSGHYRQDRIPLGDFTVEVFEAATARRGSGQGCIDLDRQEVPVNVVERALGLVKGAALASETLAPLKGWQVVLAQVSPAGRGLPSLQGTTSVDGTFSFPGASQGTFTLRVSKKDVKGQGLAQGAIEREGQVVDIPVVVNIVRPLKGRIEGTAFHPDGSRAGNSRVEICHPERSCENPVILTAAEDGTFALDDVPLGRFKVAAKSPTSANAGSVLGELEFDGDTALVNVVMVGLSEISGVVEFNDGRPASGAQLFLRGQPSSGCGTPGDLDPYCTLFADSDGRFTFVNVPARTFTLTAEHPVSGLKGSAGGGLNPGEIKFVRVVLEPTGGLSGRVLFSDDTPAQGIVGELAVGTKRLFVESREDGTFQFDVVPIGSYTLELKDPIGPGLARKFGQINGPVHLGDIALDEAPPLVSSVTPAASSLNVPLNQVFRLTFTEPIQPGTVNASNIVLSHSSGPVLATLQVSQNDTVVAVTPLNPLKDESKYTLRVKGVQDRVGKTMPADFVAGFTTVDITPPGFVDVSPAAETHGVSMDTVIRVKFTEPIDPTKFSVPAFQLLTSTGGAAPGRLDYIFGNTVVVFTPNRPLEEDAAYQVRLSSAADLAGNFAPALAYAFTTTDRTPPQVLSLTPDNGGQVIENGFARVTADVGATHDVAVVDFFINNVFAFADRTPPFDLRFQAVPELGRPGDLIMVSAVAVDTSGNRGDTPAVTHLTIIPDQPPTAVLTAPANGFRAKNGERIVVSVRATDDLGVERIGFKAHTGKPQDAATRLLSPASQDRTESFAFHVATDAAPGSEILIEASASDTKLQVSSAAPVRLFVEDAVPPVVRITGASSGQKVYPGRDATVVVTADDLGGVSSVTFQVSGAAVFVETRTLDPAQNSLMISFTFRVPSTARANESVTLEAAAVDQAGNAAAAARVVLPVADTAAPSVTLRTESGTTHMVKGRTVRLVAEAQDEVGVSRFELSGQGAFLVSDAKQVSPPLGSAQTVFSIAVPDTVPDGAVLTLKARAADVSGNIGTSPSLALTATSLSDVILPASALLLAGDTQDIEIGLSPPAPTGGLRVDFISANADVAEAAPFVIFEENVSSKTISLQGHSGGNTFITAQIQGVQRAQMTVTVRGGVVSGVVYDSLLNPATGVQLTVAGGGVTKNALSDEQGRYFVEGIPGPYVSVKALHPETRLRGFADGAMNLPNGHLRGLNVVLIPAGAVRGTVFLPDGATPIGAGTRVDIFDAGNLQNPIATTFTHDNSAYEFPLVTLGNYVVEAFQASDGNRGRSSASVTASGQELEVPVACLGRGTVSGTVRDGAGNPAANARITFRSSSVFGHAPAIQTNADPNGYVQFDKVFIGQFSLDALDPVTNQGGGATGSITRHLEVVTRYITLSSYGSLQGRVTRPDGTTPVAGAVVSVHGRSTITDSDGKYGFAVLPLGGFTVSARDAGTRGLGQVSGSLDIHGETKTADVSLFPQGTLVVTARDANNNPAPGSFLSITASNGLVSDSLFGRTGSDGTALFEHVLAGNFHISASSHTLHGSLSGALAADQVRQVTVNLEPTASIAGTVYEPDGQTPVVQGRVQVDYTNISIPLSSSGTFRIDGLTLGQYTLTAFDGQNRRRAIVKTPIPLTANGQVATRDMIFVGLGNLTGRVLNPDGSSASDMHVQVWSLAPDFGGFRSARTNAAGFYAVGNVPVGSFTVSVDDRSRQLYGEGAGAIALHGETMNVDILLKANVIPLPVSLHDANQAEFDIAGNGTLGGLGDVYNPLVTAGGFQLHVLSGAATAFPSAANGTNEEGGREIVIDRSGLAGLQVTRKIYVPMTGYFSRHLEILRNPTSEPVTVGLRLTSHVRPEISVLATSSGDDVFSVSGSSGPDRWVMLDDGVDADPFLASNLPSLAFVVDGPGAGERAGTVLFSTSPRRLVYQWDNVTVPAGGIVAYLHFGVQQLSRAAALASAERLVQLPPEALVGLSPEEMSWIRNFAVPADGTSALPSLPPLNGAVTGRVYAGDGVTTLASAQVWFKSTNIFFGRRHDVFTNANGLYSLPSQFGEPVHRPIPVDDFTVESVHPRTGVTSPAFPGAFDPGAATAVRDIVFHNTGQLRGMVRRHTGAAVSGGTVRVFRANPFFDVGTSIADDSSYRFTGVPAGTFTVTASLPHPQGTNLIGSRTAQVVATETSQADIEIQPTGGVRGTVRTGGGSPAVNVFVDLTRSGFVRSLRTDTAGQFIFTDVPEGTFAVRAIEPNTNIPSTATVTVVRDQTAVSDLSLAPLGSVQARVNFARGAAAGNAPVYIREPARDNLFRFAGTTDGGGRLAISHITLGSYALRAHHPGDSRFSAETSGQVSADGEVSYSTVTLPGVGTVTGKVLSSTGAAIVGVAVTVRSPDPAFGGFFNASTDNQGIYRVNALPLGSFSATVLDAGRQLFGEAFGQIVQDGQVVTATITVINNAVALPANRYDANNFLFDIQPGGFLLSGSESLYRKYYYGTGEDGGFFLEIASGAASARFTGTGIGTVEENGREIAVRQTLQGLNVARKAYMPREGYFVRYLETLENATTAPIQVDVKVRTNLRSDYNGSPAIRATSSGDTVLNVSSAPTADRWVVIDDPADGDSHFYNTPAAGFVFDGPGAAERAGSASFNNPSSWVPGELVYGWNGVTIPPGGKAVYMHFGIQQLSRAAARAAAERLVQLPPEALEGLSPDEIAAIRNFAVSETGTSPVAALPPLTGRVSGRLLAGDRATPVPSGPVVFRSGNILFGRSHTTYSDSAGNFRFSAALNDAGTSVVVPVSSFTLTATHPQSSMVIATTGSFDGSFTGNLAPLGTVRASSFYPGYPPSRAVDEDLNTSWFTANGDAANRGTTPYLDVILPATVTIRQINIRGNRQFADGYDFHRGRIEIFNAADELLYTEDFDLAAPDRDIDLDVPDQPGAFRVRFTSLADESVTPGLSELQVIGTASASAIRRTTEDVAFTNTGLVRGFVRQHNGAALAGVNVYAYRPSPYLFVSGYTASDGSYVLTGLPPGTVDVVSYFYHPQGSQITASTRAAVFAGQTSPADVTFGPTGSVTGTVRTGGGTPSIFSFVQLYNNFYSFGTDTNGSGIYSFTDVPAGDYTLRAQDPRTGLFSSTQAALVQDQTTTQDFTFLPVGTVRVQVTTARGAPASNSLVYYRHAGTFGYFNFGGYTNSSGAITLSNFPAGDFTVRAHVPGNTQVWTDAAGQLSTEGQVVDVNAVLPAVGSITGRLAYANGAAAPFAYTEVRRADNNDFVAYTYTSSTGIYTFGGLPAGTTLYIRAQYPNRWWLFGQSSPGILTEDGETLTLNTTLPALATVRVTVVRSDNSAFPGVRIESLDAYRNYHTFRGYTDSAGQLDIPDMPEGSFTILVRDPNTGRALGQQTGTVTAADHLGTVLLTVQILQTAGTLQGQVYAKDGVSPLAGSFVEAQDAADGFLLASTFTGADGSYRFRNVLTGNQGFVIRARGPGAFFSSVMSDSTGAFAVNGETRTFDFSLPLVGGNLKGTVYASDGATPVSGAYLEIRDAVDDSYLNRYAYTSSDGAYEIKDVLTRDHGFTLHAYTPNFVYSVQRTESFAVHGETRTLDVALPVIRGRVEGTVFAGDGATPVPGTSASYDAFLNVRVIEANGREAASIYTDNNGSYAFHDVYVSSPNFIVRGDYYSSHDSTQAERGAAFVGQASTAVVNLVMPLSVIKGAATFHDGAPLTDLAVFARGSDGNTRHPHVKRPNGFYAVVGVPVGAVDVTAQDNGSGLTVTVSTAVSDIAQPVVADLRLPPSGTVTGRVLDFFEAPVTFERVVLVSTGLAYDRYAWTDGDGVYAFALAPAGPVFLQSRFYDNGYVYSAATGTLAAGNTLTLDILPPSTGTVAGSVLDTDGVTPVADAPVTVGSSGGAGPLGRFSKNATADASGTYQAPGVPAGALQVTAYHPNNYATVGLSTAVLAGPSASVDVVLGNAVRFGHNLDGSDGFRYDIYSYGNLSDGGTADGRLGDAYDSAYYADADGELFCCADAGRKELDGRQIVLGPLPMGKLEMARKVFVPADGGFARYLEIVTNPTAGPRQVTLRVQGNLGSDGSTKVVVPSSATANTYTVTDEGLYGSPSDPSLAHVFTGAGSVAVPVTRVSFGPSGEDDFSYQWTATVPAGETVIFMHFAIQREPTHFAAAQAQAEALRDLTDPDALSGLTNEEKSQIKNFIIP